MIGQRRIGVFPLAARLKKVVHQRRQVEFQYLKAFWGRGQSFADDICNPVAASFDREIQFLDPVIRLLQGDPDLQVGQRQLRKSAFVPGIERGMELADGSSSA